MATTSTSTDLRQRYALSLAGASLKSLMGIADQLGFSTRALQGRALGARARCIFRRSCTGTSIISWCSSRSVHARLTIHDPAVGARTLSLEEFSKHFTGVVLELARAESFEPIEARAPMKLSMLWSTMTGWWSALVAGARPSAALQIAAFVVPLQMQLVVDEAIAAGGPRPAHGDRARLRRAGHHPGAIEALRSWALRVFGHLLSFQITGNLVRHLLRLPSDYFEKRHVGDIISRLGSVKPIQEAITQGVVATVIDGVMACVAGCHPVLLLDHAGFDRHRRRSHQPRCLASRCSRA